MLGIILEILYLLIKDHKLISILNVYKLQIRREIKYLEHNKIEHDENDYKQQLNALIIL